MITYSVVLHIIWLSQKDSKNVLNQQSIPTKNISLLLFMHFKYLSLLDRLGLSSKSLQRPAFVKSMKCDAICPHGHGSRKIRLIEGNAKCRHVKIDL
jgi:hypothetical protein